MDAYAVPLLRKRLERKRTNAGALAKHWRSALQVTLAQAEASATERQLRHTGCTRCVDGTNVYAARSGTACRAPTEKSDANSKTPAGGRWHKNHANARW